MKIIHFSDPHSCQPMQNKSAFCDKRVLAFINYTFRRAGQHDLNMLDKAVDYILKEKPDVAICTGDFTTKGEPAEFAEIAEKLKRLLDSQIPFLYVPGNHDSYVKNKQCQNKSLAKQTIPTSYN